RGADGIVRSGRLVRALRAWQQRLRAPEGHLRAVPDAPAPDGRGAGSARRSGVVRALRSKTGRARPAGTLAPAQTRCAPSPAPLRSLLGRDDRTGQARAGVAGRLALVVIRVGMDDQATTDDVEVIALADVDVGGH